MREGRQGREKKENREREREREREGRERGEGRERERKGLRAAGTCTVPESGVPWPGRGRRW